MTNIEKHILECLDKYCCFEKLSRDNFAEQIVRPLQENQCFNNWTWDNGVSKGVLIFSGLKFVVKIPFTGFSSWIESEYHSPCGHWCGCDSAYHSDGRMRTGFYKKEGFEDYYEFNNADIGEEGFSWDYCKAESIRYEAAVAAGLSEVFAKTELLGYVGQDEHPIYIQERCQLFDDAFSTAYEEKYKKRTSADYKKVDSIREEIDFYDINDNWILDFINFFGKEMLRKFANFCWDKNINDLHDGNIGYRNGVPCLIDYSSYDE